MPDVVMVCILRVLYVALEALLAALFWTYRAKPTTIVPIPYPSPWDRSTLEYDGLCSHSSLSETVRGDWDLSPEELERKAAEQHDRMNETRRLRRAQLKEEEPAVYQAWQTANNARHRENREQRKAKDPEGFAAWEREKNAKWEAANPVAAKARTDRNKAKAVAEKKHYCGTCDYAFKLKGDLTKHLGSKKHKNKAAEVARRAEAAGFFEQAGFSQQ